MSAISNLKRIIHTLPPKSEIGKPKSEIGKTKSEIEKLKSENQKLKSEVELNRITIGSLMGLNEQISKHKFDDNMLIIKQKEEIKQLKNQNGDLLNQNADLLNQNGDLLNQNGDLQFNNKLLLDDIKTTNKLIIYIYRKIIDDILPTFGSNSSKEDICQKIYSKLNLLLEESHLQSKLQQLPKKKLQKSESVPSLCSTDSNGDNELHIIAQVKTI